MKTVKFYNKETGRWEPIAGISEVSTGGNGTYDYNELINKPDHSIYALQSELDMVKEQMNGIAAAITNGYDLTVYTVDSGVSTYSLRSTGNTVLNGAYIPELSNGYYYISLILNNEKETIDLNTDLSEVNKIKIHYPKETTYIKFANTQVKEVIQIQGENINDATGMFTNCTSLEKADLTGLPNTVQVDSTMFAGANYEADITFSEDWEHSNHDIGLVRTVEVIMHHYREDGLYENNSIYIKSQYDEHPTQYVIRQVDPEDERWRYEPFTLEHDTPYEIYFEEDGNTSETMNACFMDNMDIFFVGGLPNSFTDTRPEIGGNEEPEEDYITDFTPTSDGCVTLRRVGEEYSEYLSLYPNETDRPINFVVEFPSDSQWSVINYTYLPDYVEDSFVRLKFTLMAPCQPFNGTAIIRETYSGIERILTMTVDPVADLNVHYKATDGDYNGDYIMVGESGPFYFIGEGTGEDDYGRYTSLTLGLYKNHSIELCTNRTENPMYQLNDTINLSSGQTEIWISDDSSEIHYENPESGGDTPEQPELKYIVYTIDSAEGGTLSSGKYLPTLNGTYSLEITKTDGTTIDDIETNAADVTNIRCNFGDDIAEINFSYTNIKEVTYISIPSSVRHMRFNECSKLEYFNGENLDTTNLSSLNTLFYNCEALKTIVGVSDWKVSNVTDFYTMFGKCRSLTSLDLSSWDVSNATVGDSMSGIFSGCSSLQNLNVSNWEVNGPALTDTFSGCSSLTSLDLSTWKVNNLTTLSWTFARCSSLTSLDLSSWDVSSVSNMGYTFGECSSLQTLNLSTWNTRNVAETYSVFEGIPSSVDWCYDGTNYSNFSLTEEQTGFNGTFPWTSSQPEEPEEPTPDPTDTVTLTLHYNRKNGDYDGWDVWAWNTGAVDGSIEFTSEDSFGKIASIEVLNGNNIGYNIRKNDWTDKNCGDEQFITVEKDMEIWVTQGQNGYYESRPNLDEVYPEEPSEPEQPDFNNVVMHYSKAEGDFSDGGYVNITLEDGTNVTNSDFPYGDEFGGFTVNMPVEVGVNYKISVTFRGETVAETLIGFEDFGTHHLWCVHEEGTIYLENPNGGDYISGFDVDPSIDNFVFDSVDNRTLNLNIYPYEQGKQVSFSIFLEDSTLANSDTLYPSIDTYEYDNGYNNAIYCSVNLQISDDLGTATLVIRESNSEIEKRISVSIVEPQPKITDFTISPESLTFSDNGTRTATVTVIPAETDRAVRFYDNIGAQSQFNITLDESEAPNKYYFHIEATQLYKEEYEPVFYVDEERSGISKSIPITIESENIWVNPQANVKVYYNRADGNYDNAQLAYNISSEGVSGSGGFYNSDDNGQYANEWILKEREVELRVFNGYDPEDGSELVVASGTFTFTEDTTLWLVEGESTFRTEKPGTEEPENPYRVEYTLASDSTGIISESYLPHVTGTYKLKMILNDGTETEDTSIDVSNVSKFVCYLEEDVTRFTFGDSTNKVLKTIEYIKLPSGVTSLQSMMQPARSLTYFDTEHLNTENITNMSGLFTACELLTSLDLSSWDVSNLKSAFAMFYHCTGLQSLNLTNWNLPENSQLTSAFVDVPSTCVITVTDSLWTLTEEQTGFTGTFTRV